MSQRSKRPTVSWRCPVCGSLHYFFPGERRKCDYKALHARIAASAGSTERKAE